MSKKKDLFQTIKKLVARLGDEPKAKAAGADDPPWLGQVAVVTGLLATLAGVLTVRSTNLSNDAIYQSDQAILAETESSDSWAEYQANSIKARIVETQLIPSNRMSAKDRSDLSALDEDLRAHQPGLKQIATDKAAERDSYLGQGASRLAEKNLLSYASLCAQLGIALASVAALVKKRSLFFVAIAIGTAGILVTAYAFASHYPGW